ncbi:MAG: response regulator [Candidatus Solibacter usitatus]|nr:response regulator [Candidatus Solibacter usitatus]
MCLFLLPQFAPAQTYNFKHFGQEQGLGSSQIKAICQDRAGFLWIGSRNGLDRFDGAKFRHYGPESGLPGTPVRDLHLDQNGILWASTSTSLARLDGDRFTNFPFQTSDDTARTYISSDARGWVYVTTPENVFVWKKAGDMKPLPLPAALRSFHGVWAEGESVWIGCGRGLCRWNGAAVETFGPSQGVVADDWRGFAKTPDGTLWVRGRRFLMTRAPGVAAFHAVEGFDHEGSGQILPDRRGRFLIPVEEGLRMRGKSGLWETVRDVNGLFGRRVSSVFEDRDGSIWLGLVDLGLARWKGNGDWEGWTKFQGLSSSEVLAVARTADGSVWAGPREGVNRRHPETGQWSLLSRKDGLPEDHVRAIAATPQGSLYVAAVGGGLARWDQASGRITPLANRPPCVRIQALSVDASGVLWVPCDYSVWAVRQPDAATPVFERMFSDQLGRRESIYQIRRDRRGRMWLAGTNGILYQAKDGTWKRIGEAQGLRAQNVVFLAIAAKGEDAIWVGYDGKKGVSKLTASHLSSSGWKMEHFDRTNRLRSNDISFLEADSQGRIWIGTDNGVNANRGDEWRYFGTSDGLTWQDTAFNSFFAGKDGSVWIGTNLGLSHGRLQDPVFGGAPPSIAVTAIRAGGVSRPVNGPIEVQPGKNILEVEFSNLSFARNGVKFRYRLRGLDEEWMESVSRSACFPNLAPGTYQFEAQAGADGVWNPAGATLSVQVLSPWWRTTWGQAFFSLAAAVIFIWLSQRRFRRVRLQREQLRRAVSLRTRELEMERDRTEQEKRTVEIQKQEIEHLLIEAKEANRLKGEFLANVSHEIRTPMNGILGMTALTLETDLAPEQREYLETAKSSATSLLSLLNDILDFSKIDANRMELESIPFSISACVDQSVKTVTMQAAAKDLSLETFVSPDLPDYVLGDPTRLRQVLLNLLTNAIKFTQQGFVRVSATLLSKDDSGTMVQFSVSDSGLGIPVDRQHVIFDSFSQADGSTTRKHGGTGLGLAICSRLVSMMSGRIWVNSITGKGSEFLFTARFAVVTIPAIRPARKSDHAQGGALQKLASAVGNGGMPHLRVLVAEDNAVNQKVLTRLLQKQGHEVEVASNGAQAVRLTTHKRFDIVLMDVQMPEMDGLEATRIIRTREEGGNDHLPILMLTANAMTGDRERCLESGADGYLSKPVSLEKLIEAISDVVTNFRSAVS